MQKFNVPIYVANLTIDIKEKSGRISTVTKKKKIKDVVIKGFSIQDMINRKKDDYSRNLNLSPKESISNIEIELLKQHGYGIDD